MSSGTVRTVSDRHSETSRVSEPFRGKRPQQPNARLRPPSFDHFVSHPKNLRWQFQAERFRGFEIDHEFELGCLHHW